MLDTPIRISRPYRTPDNKGGAVEIFDDASAVNEWCDPVLGEAGLEIVVNLDADIRVGDIVEAPVILAAGV